MNKLPLYEADSRLKRVQQTITEMEADACIITSSVNQYWLCGFIFDGFMFLFPEGDPILFVKRPSNIVDERAKQIRKPEQIPDMLREIGISLPKRILVEADQLSFSAATRLQAALGMPETKNISGEVRKIRSVKSEYELEQMRESARIHAYVYELIPSLYREGMTDLELQIEIERQMRLHGSVGIFRSFGENMDIFMGSMLAGDNAQAASPYDYALGGAGISPLLPLGANGTVLLPGTTLMVDMAGNYRPWMDDMTRTFAIEHTPDMAYKAHQVSIDIHNAIMKNFRAGALCSELYLLAEEIVNQNGLAPYFMGTIQQAQFIGHGVGLEINEPPVLTSRSKEILEPGMAFALEPKFVLPGIGAVGIENTYVVHESGFEKITLCEEAMIVLS
ncbi:Xaa-Pro aminopeptidase [Porphyromonadaceae bacterium NLAE-zl-C104]|uniref:M24 family metallopeptidase n=1 Tax=Proteiniphilum saccharofermentans TaxID=1642647 RepID=UPI0008E803AA|nr:Xaa-Pro peptidase family protein [Proteiniphilum saccharofermentans]SFS89659.1 Xaa-Pro aminopeptidase [Porphyromonadaceae bacterium NLAE-zl-C104]